MAVLQGHAQTVLHGKVSDRDGRPLAGASVAMRLGGQSGATSAQGTFSLAGIKLPDSLAISHVGYITTVFAIDSMAPLPLAVRLQPQGVSLEEVVVSTGIYQVPKERATGSFTHLDNKQLNLIPGTDILSRLEGLVEGLQFNPQAEGSAPELRIRGLSTIESERSPLIVVDNFPYEGDIFNINPNDVESVTVLRDAAAASIWGARAGNGVIVITTKTGKPNRAPTISFNSNVRIGNRPDLYHSRNRLPATAVMDIERQRFEWGNYPEADNTPIPDYVELLIQQRDGLIGGADFDAAERLLRQSDTRRGALEHLYRQSVAQQYALNVSGGGKAHTYYLSAGYDSNLGASTGDGYRRINLMATNTVRFSDRLELRGTASYVQQRSTDNGLTINDLSSGSYVGLSPYLRLVDEQTGAHLPVVKDYRTAYTARAGMDGLLDWGYYPISEVEHMQVRSNQAEVRVRGNLIYKPMKALSLSALYQYEQRNVNTVEHAGRESYYVRNMVNRFTQPDGTQVIPNGDVVLFRSPELGYQHSGRLQADYSRSWEGFDLSALAGGEIRHATNRLTGPLFRLYGYDAETLQGTTMINYEERYPTRPTGSARIPAPNGALSDLTDRFVSYYGNMSYSLHDRYTLSGSGRWDGSNLFGVRANQRGELLWSVGSAWVMSNERFFARLPLSHARLRVTYGKSGNVNTAVTHFTTITHGGPNAITGLPSATVRNIGNPFVRWESVATLNAGLDAEVSTLGLKATIEYYRKWSDNLIGDDFMDPTTGVLGDYKINYANMQSDGVDLRLSSKNRIGPVDWYNSVLVSFVKNRVTNFNTDEVAGMSAFLTRAAPPVVGRSLDALYAVPWNGLDPQTGKPVYHIGGSPAASYRDAYNHYNGDPLNTLQVAGLAVPSVFGSWNTTVSWQGLEASALFVWKAGYVFRRSSISPGAEYLGPSYYHMDYFNRWEKPGDERHTVVPSAGDYDTYLNHLYQYSSALMVKGAHVRLQNIKLGYTFTPKARFVRSMQLYANMQHLGIIWRANDEGLDPDYHAWSAPPSMVSTIGLSVNF